MILSQSQFDELRLWAWTAAPNPARLEISAEDTWTDINSPSGHRYITPNERFIARSYCVVSATVFAERRLS